MSSVVDTLPRQSLPQSRPIPMGTILWFGALLALCYAPVLYRLGAQWARDEDMGHGFFVPVIAGYIAWQSKDRLRSTLAQPNYWGLLIIAWGAIQLIVATLAAELFLARTAFLILWLASL